MRVVNVAHGEFFMLGAMLAWWTAKMVPGGPLAGFIVALVVAPLAVGFLAFLTERLLLRRINYDPEATIVATIGLLFVIQQLALTAFGADAKPVAAPKPPKKLVPRTAPKVEVPPVAATPAPEAPLAAPVATAAAAVKVKPVRKPTKVQETVAKHQKVLADARPIALAGYIGNRNLSELLKAGLLEKEKIALVGYRSTELRGEVPYLYSVRAGLRDEVSRIADHLVTVGITRLGVFHEEGPGTPQLVAMLDEVIKRTGATITARGTYPAGTAKVAGAIDAFIKAQPQAIIILATGSAAAGFIEQYRLGGGAAQLFAQSGADIEQLAQRLGEDTMKGIAIAQVTPSPYKISGRLAKEFSDLTAKATNLEVPVSYAMMEGYIAGKVIVEATRRMGKQASREGFVAALDTLDLDMGGYRVAFKPGMRSGSRFVELSIVTGSGKIRQ